MGFMNSEAWPHKRSNFKNLNIKTSVYPQIIKFPEGLSIANFMSSSELWIFSQINW